MFIMTTLINKIPPRIICFFLISNLLISCNPVNNQSKISIIFLKEINETKDSTIILDRPKLDYTLVYYFDGNCGQCLLNLKLLSTMLSSTYSKMNVFFLSSTKLNPEANKMLELLSINYPILQESIDFYFESNPVPINMISIINKNKQIVYNSYIKDSSNLRLKIEEINNDQSNYQ